MSDPATLMMVTYNRLDLTKETLEILLNNTKYPFNLVVIDNGSEDDTVNWLKEFNNRDDRGSMQDFTLVANKKNQGIAIGRNQGLFYATRNKTNWLVTIDNDIWVPEGWLTEAVDILKKNPSFGAIGVNMEPTNYFMSKLNGKTFQVKRQGNLGTACMVFNKKLHQMLGYFNHNDYGKYGEEDADWGMRTRVVGFKLGYILENGKHLGEGERDVGEYREFKTAQHQANLATFNQNCRAYASRQKQLYIPFSLNDIQD